MKAGPSERREELQGIGLSPGLVIGRAYRVEARTPTFYRLFIQPSQVEAELKRFHRALEESRRQLLACRHKLEAEVGSQYSYIVDFHLLILEDRRFLDEIEEKVRGERQSPERAVRNVGERWLEVYRSLSDPFFRERGSDLQEVVDRILANLLELDPEPPGNLPQELILVAPEVSLSMLADYDLERVKGLVVTRGGSTSHVTIIARSYRIPVVGGIEAVEKIRTGDQLVVDGQSGLVLVNPSPEQESRYRSLLRRVGSQLPQEEEDTTPARTRDGERVYLYGNTEVGNEVPAWLRLGAEGIGLFRSEFIYMRSKEGPVGEEEQFRIYRDLARTVGARPALIRTLDIGYETHPYFSRLAGERHAVLGLRGIRLSLRYPDIFRTQLRAILRASAFGNLQIILPMVSSLDELLEARALIAQVTRELREEGVPCREKIPVGIMVEVPAAVLTLELLAREADFLAVGTNDLIQYTLAAGRTNTLVSYLHNPLHPAVIQVLRHIAKVASEQQKQCIVCGEMAAQPLYAYLLIGMGLRHLSMNVFSVPQMKHQIRLMDSREAERDVEALAAMRTLREIQNYVQGKLEAWKKGEEILTAPLPGRRPS